MRSLSALACSLLLTACSSKRTPGQEVPDRCHVDLDALGLFSQTGSGARAAMIADGELGIGGPNAVGGPGDYLIENDRLRAVIQRPGRTVSPLPYGGSVIDVDLKRGPQEEGRDQLGELGLFYAFGRVPKIEKLEILDDGKNGGPAVIAATGVDTIDDFVDVEATLASRGLKLELVVDPHEPLPLQITTYYVLSPGESRLQMVSALCNKGSQDLVLTVGDLFEPGGATDFLNPQGCTQRPGSADCLVDPGSWFGRQGDGVAYGYRSYRFDAPRTPDENALVSLSGPLLSFAGGERLQGLLTWGDPAATTRPGSFGIHAGGSRTFVRDLFVARDLGGVTSLLQHLDGITTGRIDTVVTEADGTTPVPGARVAVLDPATERPLTLLVADDAGRVKVDLPSANYRLVAGVPGSVTPGLSVMVSARSTATPSLQLPPRRTLTVRVEAPDGSPLPARVTVLCPSTCPTATKAYGQLAAVEALPANLAALAFVPPAGSLELPLAAGHYEVVVSRGPEYSVWPTTWPGAAHPVDLTAGDASVTALLGRVVDSSGWLSADLHVHTIHSGDGAASEELRVLGLLAEGVELLVTADHDVVTDVGPTLRALGAESLITSIVGSEVSTRGAHHSVFPAPRSAALNGGPFDWAGGEGPTLRLDELHAGLRAWSASAVLQLNHPRGTDGALTTLRVDTATGASHADPGPLRMAPHPMATATDTRLFSASFDTFEVQDADGPSLPLLNDWMTLLSRGSRTTATAGSGSHRASTGSTRTYLRVPGADTPATHSEPASLGALKGGRAVGTNGPFLRLTAQRLDSMGAAVGPAVEVGDTVSLAPSSGERLLLTVEVQSPEWMPFDLVELYSHAGGREALDGAPNESWPGSRIYESRSHPPGTLALEEAVPGNPSLKRHRVTESFTVSPTADTWYVAMVRSTHAIPNLSPIASGRPTAFTNPVFVDADGSGAYDDFPLD